MRRQGANVKAGSRGKDSTRRGQSLIESCLAIFLICLIFTGLYQVARIYAADEFLSHAANRATRAKSVGFNRFMVTKAARVASIPNSGTLLNPDFVNTDTTLRDAVQRMSPGDLWSFVVGHVPHSEQVDYELARIPYYLGARDWWEANNVLDYSGWDDLHVSASTALNPDPHAVNLLYASVRQDFPLTVPLHRAFYADDRIDIGGRSQIENHYQLYLKEEPQYAGP